MLEFWWRIIGINEAVNPDEFKELTPTGTETKNPSSEKRASMKGSV